jgi:hypothetical protein
MEGEKEIVGELILSRSSSLGGLLFAEVDGSGLAVMRRLRKSWLPSRQLL